MRVESKSLRICRVLSRAPVNLRSNLLYSEIYLPKAKNLEKIFFFKMRKYLLSRKGMAASILYWYHTITLKSQGSHLLLRHAVQKMVFVVDSKTPIGGSRALWALWFWC